MKSVMENSSKQYLLTVFTGLLFGILFFWLNSQIPEAPVIRNHSGLSSVYLGLTLANTPDEIYEILGGPENEEFLVYVEKFKSIQFYYPGIIVLYVVFYVQMIGFSLRNSYEDSRIVLRTILIILGGIADICEALQVQKILDANTISKIEAYIFYRKIFSNFKWFCLFSVAGILAVQIWLNEKGLILKLYSIFMLSSFFFYLSSFIRKSSIELGILFLITGGSLFWIYSLLRIVLSRNT